MALSHLNLSTASLKNLSWRICFMLRINKHFNFCFFKASAYTTLGRLRGVFFDLIFAVLIKFIGCRAGG